MALKFDNIEEVSKSTEKIKDDTKGIKDNVDASNMSLSEQLALSKKIANISKQRERSEEGVFKSFTGVLANLVKGNFQEVITYGIKRKSLGVTQK